MSTRPSSTRWPWTGGPGAGGVVVVPYLDGERTPNRPDATGEVHGLRSDARREDLARAAYEGVVCGLLDGLDVLIAEVGVDARSHRARGRRGPVAGLPVRPRRPVGPARCVVPDHPEQAAAGACVQAAAVLHQRPVDEVRDAWNLRTGTVTEPAPDGSTGRSCEPPTASPWDSFGGLMVDAYRDASLGVEDRVHDLLGRMDIDEKVAQLGCLWVTCFLSYASFDHFSLSSESFNKVATRSIITPAHSPTAVCKMKLLS